MPIILVSLIFLSSNLFAALNVNDVVLIVADIAFLVFFNKKYVGLSPEIWYTDVVVGFNDPDAEKSITSSIKNFILLSKLEVIWVFSGMIIA